MEFLLRHRQPKSRHTFSRIIITKYGDHPWYFRFFFREQSVLQFGTAPRNMDRPGVLCLVYICRVAVPDQKSNCRSWTATPQLAKLRPILQCDRFRSLPSLLMRSAARRKRRARRAVMTTFASPSAHVTYWGKSA